MSTATPWLPRSALRDGKLDDLLTRRARDWGARWFCAQKVIAAHCTDSVPPNLDESTSWATACGGVALTADMPGQIEIAKAMLGVEPGWSKVSRTDLSLLRALAGRCAEDLLTGAAAFFGASVEIDRGGPRQYETATNVICFAITIGPAIPVLHLYVSQALAAAARKAAAPTQASADPLGSRQDAIALQDIRIGAMLGVATLELADLYALGEGDVLVLDRQLGDSFHLTINGEPTASLQCQLDQDAGGACLRLTKIAEAA